MESAFEHLAGDPRSPVVIHVPHAGTTIPPGVRAGIALDGPDLRLELLRMTDWHTDQIALTAHRHASPRPWVFRNRLSRLVVDPERFPDGREEMEAVGMGAVYTRTHDGRALRQPTPAERHSLLGRYFFPYAEALRRLVDERLAACGGVVLIDLHSYASQALPYELHADGQRPEICIGTDDFHTSAALSAAAAQAFGGLGRVGFNSPFAGTYVPLQHYRVDSRVQSLMLEIRRDVYMDESRGEAESERIERIGQAIAELIAAHP